MVARLLKLLRLDEVDEQSQAVFEQVRNSNLVLGNKLRPHKAVLVVLDQLTEVDHQPPWERSLGLQALEQDRADLLLNHRVRLIEQD